ncbi:sulfotransferase [Sphingorhabdus sp. M41]|uniref:sulfotransferase-like domain-containing protein n=1 Tax=Sphingorhabdus sp. M41 TaxID=1806885 RepID=UPI00078DB38B|nr:sulfotransferase [Sphingorhabdus sp. M41]AMO71770.1 branched-chain amino acid aminotransferase [Sphingorhabdus sp. M41]
MTIRIAMWSGPRNISTAMMRSFGGRSDCAVSDEPFYGAFLKTTGQRQPMADEVIASMDCDWQSVAEDMRGPVPNDKAVWYQKHMPHHMVSDVSIDDFPDHRHAFLIRDPERVVASYAAKRVEVTADDLGYGRQLEYVDRAAQLTGKPPVVLDSADILRDPEGYLRAICAVLDIPWDPGMLSWQSGQRETDGIWASHWYGRVIETTGFGQPESTAPRLGEREQAIADQCRDAYSRLSALRIQL